MRINEEFKIHYNKTLARYKKAEKFFNNDKISFEQKERFFEEFNKVVKTLSMLMKEFAIHYGREMTDKEINEGF